MATYEAEESGPVPPGTPDGRDAQSGARRLAAARGAAAGRRVAPPHPGVTGRPVRRGLVLGGGGMLGAAWTTGALCAVQEATGWDPRTADVILGTSAGSVLGTLLGCGASPCDLLAHQRGERIGSGPLVGVAFDYDTAAGGPLPPRPRAAIGSPGLARLTVRHPRTYPFLTMVSAFAPPGRGSVAPIGELVRALAPVDGWSRHAGLRLVAVDYGTGQRVTFGDPGAPRAPLADAVMASCAIPGWFAPVRLDGRCFVDGGAWSATNVDLLAGRGLDEVYVLAPMAVRMRMPGTGRPEEARRRRGMLARLVSGYRRAVTRQMHREAALLRASGVRVQLLAPTPADLAAMGPNVMDPARRPQVLETALQTCAAALAPLAT